MYADEIYFAIDHNLTECLNVFYKEYVKQLKDIRPDKECMLYTDWINFYEEEHKTDNLERIKNAIIRYVDYDGSTLKNLLVKHEHWSDFMRTIKECVPFKNQKAFNNLDNGFEVHFDLEFGVSFKFEDILGYFMTWEDFCEFYKTKVYDWENDEYGREFLYR